MQENWLKYNPNIKDTKIEQDKTQCLVKKLIPAKREFYFFCKIVVLYARFMIKYSHERYKFSNWNKHKGA